MAGGVKLELNDKACKEAINEAINNGLRLAMAELHAKVVRDTPVKEGDLKGSWQFEIDENNHEAVIGSPLEYAIYNEFGTGEYSAEGNGRKGGWWIPVGAGGIDKKTAERYHWSKVKRKDGEIVAVFTYGQKPKRTMQNAFNLKKRKMENLIKRAVKEIKADWKPNKIIGKGDFDK